MRSFVTRSALLLTIGVFLLPGGVLAEGEDPGQKAFMDQKCNMCHAVSSAGIEAKTTSEKMRGPDLKGVTSRHEPEWIEQFIRQQIEVEGSKHKKGFTGSDEEMKALLEWLKQQN